MVSRTTYINWMKWFSCSYNDVVMLRDVCDMYLCNLCYIIIFFKFGIHKYKNEISYVIYSSNLNYLRISYYSISTKWSIIVWFYLKKKTMQVWLKRKKTFSSICKYKNRFSKPSFKNARTIMPIVPIIVDIHPL